MKTSEFIKALFSYYEQDLSSETNKIRMKFIGKWIEENTKPETRADLLYKVLNEYKPRDPLHHG